MRDSIEWWPLLAGLFGGLGLFLLGVQRLTLALKTMAGEKIRRALARLTSNRVTAALTGVGVTAVVQSSSITTVLAVGFVSAGLLGTVPALGVVLGANVGTTITAQIVAFDIRSWALAMIAVGAITLVATTRERPVRRADAALGLGLVLFSMRLMSDSVTPLRTSSGFLDVMARLDVPALGLLAGVAATVLLQSSSATTALAIVLTSQGLISTPAAVAVVIGANVGTCVTAGLAAIGKPVAAKQVAVGHIVFNLIGAGAWIGLVSQLTWMAERLPGSDGDAGRTLANAHTVFNLVNGIVALLFLGPLARLVEWVVRERPGRQLLRHRHETIPLDAALLASPALALAATRKELIEMSSVVAEMSAQVAEVVLAGTPDAIARLRMLDDDVDAHHRHVVGYLTQLGRQALNKAETESLVAALSAANDLEAIGDVIETNLVRSARHRLERGIDFDARAGERLRDLHTEVHQAVLMACESLIEENGSSAQLAVEAKVRVHQLVDHIVASAIETETEAPLSLDAYTLEREIAEHLRRIAHIARRIARLSLTPG